MSTIRPATPDDASEIAALAAELGYPVNTAAMHNRLEAILASPADLVLVAIDAAGTIMGWLQAHAAHILESGFRVEIVGLIVSPAIRRRGVGRALVAEAEHWARTLAADTIVVRSNARRLESHLFYPSLGYSVSKTQFVYRKAIPPA